MGHVDTALPKIFLRRREVVPLLRRERRDTQRVEQFQPRDFGHYCREVLFQFKHEVASARGLVTFQTLALFLPLLNFRPGTVDS